MTSRKRLAIAGSAVFLVIAPGFVAGLAPWWISPWQLEAPFFGMPLFRFAGGMLTTVGVISLLDSFIRFAVQGWARRPRLSQPSILLLPDYIVMSEIQCT